MISGAPRLQVLSPSAETSLIFKASQHARGRQARPSLPLPISHQDAVQVEEFFQTQTPPASRGAVEAMEEEVCRIKQQILNGEVDAEMIAWIPDTDSTRARDTKYYRTVELYWHIKDLLGEG